VALRLKSPPAAGMTIHEARPFASVTAGQADLPSVKVTFAFAIGTGGVEEMSVSDAVTVAG
jgi:hypothetical protein